MQKKEIIALILVCFFVGLAEAGATGGDDDILLPIDLLKPAFDVKKTPSFVPPVPPVPPVHVAQLADTTVRINQLENQVRQLNGQVEELNFQLLQIQEQMRKMQEDNEFRFQELETKKHGELDQPGADKITERKKTAYAVRKANSSQLTDAKNHSNNDIDSTKIANDAEVNQRKQRKNSNREYKKLSGEIAFDSLDNSIDPALGKPLDLTTQLGGFDNQIKKQNVRVKMEPDFSSIGSAKEMYELGYDYFQIGDYVLSQRIFSEFIDRFPDDEKIPNVQFWLGESMLSQAHFKEAAKVFLDAYTNWPNASIAPQTLLKLGVSLGQMEQRELACSTYAKVFKQYPDMSSLLKKRVVTEQRSAHCLNG